MPPSRGLLKIRFNQQQGCFSCALESGVLVYNVDPLARKTRLDFDTVGGVGHVEMLERTNLLAVVGGGQASKFPDRNVMIWDDVKEKFVYEFAFATPVLSVRMRRDKIVVVLFAEIHVFSFPDQPKLLTTIQTIPNPQGLCEVCPSLGCQLMVFPSHQMGFVQIVDLLSMEHPEKASTEMVCHVHQHNVSCIAINQSGTKIATTSTKGTLIRIHSTHTRQMLAEFRRGVDPANIYCINFSLDSQLLCVSSDKGTVHVFAVDDQSLNKRSSLAQVGLTQVGLLGKTVGTYMDSQWGLAHFSIPNETPCLCAFVGDKKSVVVICMDGSLYKFCFSLEGNSFRDSYDQFLEVGNDEI